MKQKSFIQFYYLLFCKLISYNRLVAINISRNNSTLIFIDRNTIHILSAISINSFLNILGYLLKRTSMEYINLLGYPV